MDEIIYKDEEFISVLNSTIKIYQNALKDNMNENK